MIQELLCMQGQIKFLEENWINKHCNQYRKQNKIK